VILSTHIVEDVTNLCSDMAIICLGEVVAKGNPNDLVAELHGKVFKKLIEKTELDTYRADYQVISTSLKMGKTQIRVVSDEPLGSFEATEPDLEDVYFSEITARQGLAV